ncbi:MAG: hypothetical protein JOZ51_09590 [Chloroflexi bacterium]|nr:hypothetical protein [Chloroflexota bacterium]
MQLIDRYSHLSPKQFAEVIIDNLHTSFGVDLKPIFASVELSVDQKARRARAALFEAILSEADRSGALLDFAPGTDFDEDPFVKQLLAEEVGEVEIEPNLALTQGDANYVMAMTGREIHTYLYTLTKRMENMANAKTAGQLAVEMVSGGLVGIGIPMAVGAIKGLRAGMTLLNAVRAGITSVGLKTAIGVVVVALVGFLLYLFLDNPKKILGMVINNTDEDFVVNNWRKGIDGAKDGNLFMEHGHMANFMQDSEEGLQSRQIQIKARAFFAENDPDNVIFGGIYFADRNFGLRGSEGVMVFTSTTTSLSFAHQFAVPYTNDNGTNIRLINGAVPDIQALYREMYETRKVQVDATDGDYRLRSGVNDARGGVVGCIASISKLSA